MENHPGFAQPIPKNGFTIIEMIVVIFIIGILVSVALTNLNRAKERARLAATRSDMDEIVKTIVAAREEAQKELRGITGSVCSACPCAGRDLRQVPDDDGCATSWNNALANIKNAAASLSNGISAVNRDVWGSPYLLDENEGENGPKDCRNDTLISAGPDGVSGTADDISLDLPLYSCR
jgi:prepilin-type N-terminal cleavage/methylation domain-containing protein